VCIIPDKRFIALCIVSEKREKREGNGNCK
jgi:hypothetical protein